ncbi:MAG: hypothetical protein CL816_07480 [Coxiellaceae bacterium]|nr:hypothetical protein [Coxiellaceae bacterium]|tara:strand:- start:1341 stop:1688 length:348 start_codon:yes stop_codon:yes gene_type:complete
MKKILTTLVSLGLIFSVAITSAKVQPTLIQMFTAAEKCKCMSNCVEPVLKRTQACNQYQVCLHSYKTEHHRKDIQNAMVLCCNTRCVTRVYKKMGDELGVSIFKGKESPGTDDDS